MRSKGLFAFIAVIMLAVSPMQAAVSENHLSSNSYDGGYRLYSVYDKKADLAEYRQEFYPDQFTRKQFKKSAATLVNYFTSFAAYEMWGGANAMKVGKTRKFYANKSKDCKRIVKESYMICAYNYKYAITENTSPSTVAMALLGKEVSPYVQKMIGNAGVDMFKMKFKGLDKVDMKKVNSRKAVKVKADVIHIELGNPIRRKIGEITAEVHNIIVDGRNVLCAKSITLKRTKTKRV